MMAQTMAEPYITIIPANSVMDVEAGIRYKQLRVAAYCRVSMEQEEQQSSYEAQIEYYTDKIARNSEWSLAGIFADDGISGTSANKRPQFMKLMQLCKKGKVDMVLTKSISRFSRNTLDCLHYIRALRDLKIPVVFEKEGINTMQMASEMTISLLGSFAQAESESLSKNVTWGKRQSFKNGKVSFAYSRFLGYEKGEDGKPKIVPEEA
jgi:DNA invertase Pin-like site-specific DNA recombinase